MKLKLPITIILLFAFCQTSFAFLSFEDHILTSFPEAVRCTEKVGLPGPIAKEITQWAIIRQLHENSLKRPATYCIPGISCGSWNEKMLLLSLKSIPNRIELGKIRDSEGVPMYVLSGNKANLISTATIAKLFDYYIENFHWFSTSEKRTWKLSKKYSYLVSQGFELPDYIEAFNGLKQERYKLLRRCNNGYGPGSDRVAGEIERLENLNVFHRSLVKDDY